MNRVASSWRRTFAVFWLGQLVTQTGSALTRFALGVWVYQQTGSASQFGLMVLFASLPALLAMPLAGALVDRMESRRALMLSDVGAALCTGVLALLLGTGHVALWQVWLLVAGQSLCATLGQPAHFSVVAQLAPGEHAGRASGLVQAGDALAQLGAPVLAGVLVTSVGLGGVVLIDFATFLLGMASLAVLPALPPAPGERKGGVRALAREALEGWHYLRGRAGLLGVLGVWAALNFVTELVAVAVTPLMLSFTGPVELGGVMAIAGLGVLIGAVVMGAWGGPKRTVDGAVGAAFVGGLATCAVGAWRTVPWVAFGLFVSACCLSIMSGCVQAIWARCVSPEVRGRVYSVRALIQGVTVPLCAAAAGPLTEGVLDGVARRGGLFPAWEGAGAGRGLALLFLLAGVGAMGVATAGFLHPRVRAVESPAPPVDETPASV